MDKKENTFAKEVEAAKVTPAEEMKRNQVVQLMALQSQRKMVQMDIDHIEIKLSALVTMKVEVHALPDCEWKAATMESIERNIQHHGKALEASTFGIVNAMNLDALVRLENLALTSEAEKEVSVN